MVVTRSFDVALGVGWESRLQNWTRESQMTRTVFYIATGLLIAGCGAPSVTFECGHIELGPATNLAEHEDRVYTQTLTYLDHFVDLITEPSELCPTGATVTTEGPPSYTRECMLDQDEMPLIIKQSRQILSHPEAFRSCFTLNALAEDQFTPSQELANQSTSAAALGRPLLSDYYARNDLSLGVRAAGAELSKNFLQIIGNTMSDDQYVRFSYMSLSDLWATAGWSPMYSRRTENALSDQFKGGYAYAEIVGPNGMLNIKTIDGEPYDLELGMTVQAADSFYPYHLHRQGEIYMDISDPECLRGGTYALFDGRKVLDGGDERRPEGGTLLLREPEVSSTHFSNSAPGEVFFFKANYVHSFDIKRANGANAQSCSEPVGLVSVWARNRVNTLEEGQLHTKICDVQGRAAGTSLNDVAVAGTYDCGTSSR